MVARTFDPLHTRVDVEVIATRAGESDRYMLPFNPSAPTRLKSVAGTLLRTTGSGATILRADAKKETFAEIRFGDSISQRLFPLDLVSNQLTGRTIKFSRGPKADIVWLNPFAPEDR